MSERQPSVDVSGRGGWVCGEAVEFGPHGAGRDAGELFGAGAPFGLPAPGQPLTFLVPAGQLFDFAAWLTAQGAASIAVTSLDFVFEPQSALYAELEKKLG